MNSLLLILGALPAADPCPHCQAPQPGHIFPFPDPASRAAPAEAPNWDATIRRAGWCPAPAVQAFQKLPRVCPVEVCPCETGEGGAYSPRVWVKEFHHAAQVPLPRFTIDGREITADGLLIYEGMRLTVDPATGNYDLSFTATVPSMPVTLRMQLVLTEPVPQKEQSTRMPRIPANAAGNPHEPPKDFAPATRRRIRSIAHRAIRACSSTQNSGRPSWREKALTRTAHRPTITCDWLLSRIGTARFGTPVRDREPSIAEGRLDRVWPRSRRTDPCQSVRPSNR